MWTFVVFLSFYDAYTCWGCTSVSSLTGWVFVHDKEDGEADDLVRVRVRVRIRVRARARARARARVKVGRRSRLDGEADDRGEVAHDGVEVAEHLDGGQLAHPHECLHLEEDLEAARAPGWGWGVGSG